MSAEVESNNFVFWTSAASSLTLLSLYYVFNVAHKPKIYASNKLKAFLVDHVPLLNEKYWPTWYNWEGRLQSLMGLFQRISDSQLLPYTREIVTLQDGGELALDCLEPDKRLTPSATAPASSDESGVIIFLLPGLTSCSQTSYVKSLALACTKVGTTVYVLNNRGLGGVPLKTPRTYCATKYEDVMEVIAHLKQKHPKEKMVAIGTSLGGMVLCQYLIGHPEEAKENFAAAIVISICWDPLAGTRSLETPFVNKYIVNYTLTSNLTELAVKHRDVLQRRDCWDFDKVLSSRTLREFDSHFTVPQFGYTDVLDYYKDAVVTKRINQFSIPVFALNAVDDPLIPGDYLPTKEAELDGSNLALIVTERGGHLGFLEGVLPVKKPFHYMERVVMDFLVAFQSHSDDLKV